ncbi:histone-fold-containing protein [Obba rivulosa]|uniref:Histone-fold-containing protein n=1 Tax=Obba rivulosa TaxID=1052685 RepID=A0A8E2DP88_9APHY|nr:histone-fold-containing protein [Obba rivulosa]
MSSPSMKPFVESGQPLHEFLSNFWHRQIHAAETETPDYRHPPLPLARIKKVMKSDPEVKMIAADAPVLFCKACEIFIAEITARAFIIADSNKRRTLSRADIAKALTKSDQFDFLIDIVPREDPNVHGVGAGGARPQTKKVGGMVVKVDQKQLADSREDSLAAAGENGEEQARSDVPSSVVLDQLQELLTPPGPVEPRPLT